MDFMKTKPNGMLKVRLKALRNNPYAQLSCRSQKPSRSRIERAIEGKHSLKNPLPENILTAIEDIKFLELQKSLLDAADSIKANDITQKIKLIKKRVRHERNTIKFD